MLLFPSFSHYLLFPPLPTSLQCFSSSLLMCFTLQHNLHSLCIAATEAGKSNLTCTQRSMISPAWMNWKCITDIPLKRKITVIALLRERNILLLGLKLDLQYMATNHTHTPFFLSLDVCMCRYCVNDSECGFMISLSFFVLFHTVLSGGVEALFFTHLFSAPCPLRG